MLHLIFSTFIKESIAKTDLVLFQIIKKIMYFLLAKIVYDIFFYFNKRSPVNSELGSCYLRRMVTRARNTYITDV